MPLDTNSRKFKTERYDLVTAAGVAPGAGNSFVWNVPDNRVVHIIAVTFRFITGIVVADRWPFVQVQTGGVADIGHVPVMQAQAASLSMTYYLTSGIVPVDLTGAVPAIPGRISSLGCYMEIKHGEQLRIGVFNLDAADVIDNVRFRYREWEED